MASELKAKLKEVYDVSIEIDRNKKKYESLRQEIIPMLVKNNLTKTKFDFGDKIIYYKRQTDRAGLSQKLIKNFLESEYPEINHKQFMTGLLASCESKDTINLVLQRKRGGRVSII